jgi:integrase/recombinase XerD
VVFLLLKFAVKDFMDDREYQNVSSKTMSGYRHVLGEFQEHCAKGDIVDATNVTQSIVKSYLMYCKNERNNNPTSMNTKLRVLKSFFNYLAKNGIINDQKHPTKHIPFVKEDIKIEVYSDYHIQQMLSYYRRIMQREKTFYGYRDYMIIVFFLGTGVRSGELINLKWNDIDFLHGHVVIFGKKRQQSSIPITEKLIKELSQYKVFCEQNFKRLSEYVFPNRYNKKLTENGIKCIFTGLKRVMNFKDVRLSCHTFRHTVAHRMVKSGCDIFTVQKLLRHEDIATTQKYLALWGTALKEMNDRYNPLNNIEV